MPYYSPLRYPGGKRRLFSVVTRLVEQNRLEGIKYAEPFAGGAAIALSLLFDEYASEVHLNDLSRPIFAFWNSAVNNTDDLCDRIEDTPINMDEWYRQRAIYEIKESADLADLAFATLFLNRTNRSGIIAGGVIGGKHQAGAWSLDARFNKDEIVRRIRKIGRYRSRIRLYQMDALDFVEQQLMHFAENSFTFIDPPYIRRGKDLYLNDYTPIRHFELAKTVQRLNIPWICTYDRAAVELGLYAENRRIEYGLPYTAQGRHKGAEVMFFSHDLCLPAEWVDATESVQLTPERSRYQLYGEITNPTRQLESCPITAPV